MNLKRITLASLVAAAIAFPAPDETGSSMKRQLGAGDSNKEGAPRKRADVKKMQTITSSVC